MSMLKKYCMVFGLAAISFGSCFVYGMEDGSQRKKLIGLAANKKDVIKAFLDKRSQVGEKKSFSYGLLDICVIRKDSIVLTYNDVVEATTLEELQAAEPTPSSWCIVS